MQADSPPTFSDHPALDVPWLARTGGFADWVVDGVRRDTDGQLILDTKSAVADGEPPEPSGPGGPPFYNGGPFVRGDALSPVIPTPTGCAEVIASWNADTPDGTWTETSLRACRGERWTKWYSLGVWASSAVVVARHSVGDQGDADGDVETDTLVLKALPAAVTGLQARVRLFTADPSLSPTVRALHLAVLGPARPVATGLGDPRLWGTRLAVPAYSQMVYLNGGNVWCSPTSVAMVLAYWDGYGGPPEPMVRAAVAGVYDAVYGGHGNWSFNTAYAASKGLAARVVRLSSLADAEPLVHAGVPVILSYGWNPGELPGAPVTSSRGHLGVLVGFTATGDPIVNDPAADRDGAVTRVYPRDAFEAVWQRNSRGTAYIIHPPAWQLASPPSLALPLP